MNALAEAFSDPSRLATLVTAVLSSAVAVVVVFLTHSFAFRRTKAELHAKKLEELYAAVNAYSDIGWKYMHERLKEGDASIEIMAAYREAYNKLDLLASLYANHTRSKIESMNLLVILTKDDGVKNSSSFPERLSSFVKEKHELQEQIASKVRALV
jgi:hypothetical protein